MPSHGSIRSGLDHWRMTISQTYASTENAVLLCQVDPDETPRDVLDRARRTGAELGVLFDCGDQLAGATRVDPSTVARTLRSFDGAS